MQLFKRGIDWQKEKLYQRINLVYTIGQSTQAISQAVKKNNFTTLFVINFARNLQKTHIDEINNTQLESYIFDPKKITQLSDALKEIQEFVNNNSQAKINIVINDWETILYLYNNESAEERESFSKALIQLKLLSDNSQVYIISKVETQSCNILQDWIEVQENINNTNNSAFAEEKPSVQFSTPAPQQQQSEPAPAISPSEQYNNLIEKLAQAQNKQDLLDIRQNIQTDGASLTDNEKLKLNDAYKVHLQRIKLAEEKDLTEI